jgi:hypothetical protein
MSRLDRTMGEVRVTYHAHAGTKAKIKFPDIGHITVVRNGVSFTFARESVAGRILLALTETYT